MDIQFYGEVDKDRRGNRTSEYPAWYLENHMEDLQDSISSREGRLKRGEIPIDNVPYEKQELAKEKKLLDDIERSKPKVSIGERQKLVKFYRELSDEIQRSMFTHTDMQRGIASAHEEARRMVKPCIPINKDLAKLAHDCGIKVEKGKVSRNGAAKIFKLVGKLIDEPTNIEVLRLDEATQGRNSYTVVPENIAETKRPGRPAKSEKVAAT
jgi:hypothetical protein